MDLTGPDLVQANTRDKDGFFVEELIHLFEHALRFNGDIIVIGFTFQFSANLWYFQIYRLGLAVTLSYFFPKGLEHQLCIGANAQVWHDIFAQLGRVHIHVNKLPVSFIHADIIGVAIIESCPYGKYQRGIQKHLISGPGITLDAHLPCH